MKQRRQHRSEVLGPKQEKTLPGKLVLLLIAVLPMLATIGYGATEVWAFIPLSLLTALLLTLWAVHGHKVGEIAYSTSMLQIPIITLIAIGLIQLLPFGPFGALSLDPYATRFFTLRLVMLAIFFAAALSFIDDKKNLKRIALAIVIFGGVMAFAGILQKLASPDAIYGMRPTPQAIPFGPFVNQHHFAAFMEMTIGITFGLLLGDVVERNRKALLMIAMLLMVIAVVMTGSRGGVISTLGVAAFVLFAHFYLRRNAVHASATGRIGLKIAIASAAALILVAFAVLFLSGADPLVRGLGMGAQADVTSGRTHFWSVALKVYQDHPIIGAGFDAFGVAFTRHDTWNGFFRVEQAHNDYLQALADGGVLAFLCVVAFIALFFRRASAVVLRSTSPTRRSIAVGAMAGCVGILIHSFFDFPLRTPSNAYFFLLLVALATVGVGDERKSGERHT